jgi:membrane associated rhomboid family serine protease
MLAGWGGASGAPVSQIVLVAYAALFLVGLLTSSFFLGGLPFQLLAGQAGTGWQVWRFLTAPLSYPASADVLTILFAALSGVFWWLTAPQLERLLGTRRFLGVAATASVIGTAGTMLSGGVPFGLTAPLFGLFAALLVEVWDQPQLRAQILVMTGINLLISLAFGGSGLAMLVGGMVGGAGSLWLLRTGPSRGWKPRTPILITVAVCVGLVALTVLRSGIAL